MVYLKRFLHRLIREEALRDPDLLAGFEARGRWVPEEIQDFDEVEFALSLDPERDVSLNMALEKGRVARLVIGWVPAGDEEADPRASSEEQIDGVLEQLDDRLTGLLQAVTSDVDPAF